MAELWAHAALDLFSRYPQAAWQAMPIGDEKEGDTESPLVRRLNEAIVASARQRVAFQLSFYVSGQGRISLSQLAVEGKPLEQILTQAETADLASLPSTLPSDVRDNDGRWRSVLDDWRATGADIPEEISIERALELVADEARPVSSTIALVAAGLDENLDGRLLELPCIVAQDGRHLVPPSDDSPDVVAAQTTPLAEQLGVVTLLHTAHLDRGKAAVTVLEWLRKSRALLDVFDDRAVVRRLAAAGKMGRRVEPPLEVEKVQALRDAFELLDPADQRELGPDVGRAVSLQAYQYVTKGRRKQRKRTSARPVDAYLPRAIDRETDSFAFAAGQSPGLVWLSDRYARVLRSSAGREGIGAQRFLRLLGAEIAPRLRLHALLEERYDDPRKGLPDSVPDGPSARSQAMRARDATYTLQDRDCPALTVAIYGISRVRLSKQRRKRAGALVATMGRAWDRLLSDYAEVDSASDYYGWNSKGWIPAYWLWEARAVAWLDDESGTPQRPSDLRLRTPGTIAIYGEDAPNYLHSDLDSPNRHPILAALGVSGSPSRSELVARLKYLREHSEGDNFTSTELTQETAVVYKALAQSLTPAGSSSDLNPKQLRTAFQSDYGLIWTNLGWRPPQSALSGPAIFGQFRAFAPNIADTSPLWRALRLKEPSPEDCLEVIRKIARRRGTPDPEEQAILLESLRKLAAHPVTGSTTQARRKLAQLPLWTSKGWVRKRPVYATDNPMLAAGLGNRLPVWEPGGELEQFRPLLRSLRIEEIRTTHTEVIEPKFAYEDKESTDLFRSAVGQLQEDLARNDPVLDKSVRMAWGRLRELNVHVHSSLAVGVCIVSDGIGTLYECTVAANVDVDRGAVFVKSPLELPRVDGGGRALATLFGGDSRRLAQAWRAAWDRAEAGREAQLIELAEQRSEREQEQVELDIARRTAAFKQGVASKHRHVARSGGRTVSGPTSSGFPAKGGDGDEASTSAGTVRVLVDPRSLSLVDAHGRITEGVSDTRHKTVRGRHLVEPMQVSRGPYGRSPIRSYSDLDKEVVGLELLQRVLNSDDQGIVDLRAQRGVGADAVDELGRFYELKVSAGAEPDQVTLTDAEVKRALTTPDFFLVIVSGIEGVDARPTVRVVVAPLKQLTPTDSGSIILSGVRSATSLAYHFAARPASEEGELPP